jgi:AmmeMemoRadiSam system protein B
MDRPKLRAVERIPLHREGEQLLLLRDGSGIAEPMAIDASWGPLLDRLDGARTREQIRHSLLLGGAPSPSAAELDELLTQLSSAGFLDDEAFRTRWKAIYDDFVEAPTRAGSLAGIAYPDSEPELRLLLGLGEAVVDPDVVGVVLPHSPLHLTADAIREALRRLPDPATLEAVVVVGTDHRGGLTPFVVTAKSFQTPSGTCASHEPLVDALERRVPWIRREELRHRSATTIELALVALHARYGSAMPPVVPLLCSRDAARGGPECDEFLGAMESLLHERAVLWVICAELGHRGPAYGGGRLDETALAAAAELDAVRAELFAQGRVEAFVAACLELDPRDRPSGAAALATGLRLVPAGTRAEVVALRRLRPPGPQDAATSILAARLRRRPPAHA